jgi:hypothetical protein
LTHDPLSRPAWDGTGVCPVLRVPRYGIRAAGR